MDGRRGQKFSFSERHWGVVPLEGLGDDGPDSSLTRPVVDCCALLQPPVGRDPLSLQSLVAGWSWGCSFSTGLAAVERFLCC